MWSTVNSIPKKQKKNKKKSSPGSDPATRYQAALELRMGGFQTGGALSLLLYLYNCRQRQPLGQVPAHPYVHTDQLNIAREMCIMMR